MRKPNFFVGILFTVFVWAFCSIPAPIHGAPILLVDDDCQGCGFFFPDPDLRPFYENALSCAGFGGQYDIWTVPDSTDGPTSTDMTPYTAVIWFTGANVGPILTANDEAALTVYLTGGGKLFFVSQGYLSEVCGFGNPSCTFSGGQFAYDRLDLRTASTDPVGSAQVSLVGATGSVGDGMGITLHAFDPFIEYYDRFTHVAIESFNDDTGSVALQDAAGACNWVFFAYPLANIIDSLSTHSACQVMQSVLTCMGFVPPSDDIGIAFIDNPAPGVSPQTALNPQVTLENYTGNDQNNFTVTCVIDSAGTQVYSDAISITDTLQGNSSRTFTFNFWFPGPEGAQYTATFYHNLSDDNSSNDTAFVNVSATWCILFDNNTQVQQATNFPGAILAKRMTPGAAPYQMDSVAVYITNTPDPTREILIRFFQGGALPPANPVDLIPPISLIGATPNAWNWVPVTDTLIINSGNVYIGVEFTPGPIGPYIGVDTGEPWFRRDWITSDTIPPYIWFQNANPMITWAFKNLMIRACGHLTQPVSHDIGVTLIAIVDPVCAGRFYNIGAQIRNFGNVAESFQADLVIVDNNMPSDTVFTSTASVNNLSPGTTQFALFTGWQVPPPESIVYRLTACAPLPGDSDTTNNCLDKTVISILCVGVEENPEVNIPRSYDLSLSQPNPMSHSTMIQYAIPKEDFVSLRIYDVTGRVIRSLVEEVQNPGYYSNIWDGRDWRGQSVSNGIYFYKLISGNFESTKKIVVLR